MPLMQQAQEELSSSECNIEDVNDVGTYINMVNFTSMQIFTPRGVRILCTAEKR